MIKIITKKTLVKSKTEIKRTRSWIGWQITTYVTFLWLGWVFVSCKENSGGSYEAGCCMRSSPALSKITAIAIFVNPILDLKLLIPVVFQQYSPSTDRYPNPSIIIHQMPVTECQIVLHGATCCLIHNFWDQTTMVTNNLFIYSRILGPVLDKICSWCFG